MKALFAFLVRLPWPKHHQNFTWKHIWRSFVIKFYWHKTIVVNPHCVEQSYTVCCDSNEYGCLLSCRRQKKLAEWEKIDAKGALPKARLL